MDTITRITTPGVPEPQGDNFSNCLRVGNQLFLSGMTAADPDADAYAQSVSCLERVKALVEAAGGTLSDVMKINVYLTDVDSRGEFSRARAEFFPGRKPCSTLVGIAALARPGLVVEVEAMAILGAGNGEG